VVRGLLSWTELFHVVMDGGYRFPTTPKGDIFLGGSEGSEFGCSATPKGVPCKLVSMLLGNDAGKLEKGG